MYLIFMGTPEFAVPALEALLASGHEIIAVYTQPPRPAGRGMKLTPSPIHTLAEKNNIPIFTPASLRSTEEQEKFRALNADVAVVVAYGLLLPKAILEGTKLGCINIHPSALPRWRGAAPIQRTVMAGDKTTDICIMQMDEGLDTGDVLLRRTYPVPSEINAGELHDMLAQEAPALLLQTLEQLVNGTAKRTKQSDIGVTYAAKITKDECRIDWTKPAAEIINHIRGLAPSPGASCILNGETLKIFKASPIPNPQSPIPGTILDNRLAIACGEGVIIPEIVQRPGKEKQSVETFLRGNPVAIGTKIE